jgi:hypothetical protein
MREAGIKAQRENSVGLAIRRKGDEDEMDVNVEELLELGGGNVYARAAVAAQEHAHLGVGAMARAAYEEVDGRNRNRNRREEAPQPRDNGLLGRLLGGIGGGGGGGGGGAL